MKFKALFLRWFLMAVIIFTGLIIAIQIDGFQWIDERDVSKLSFVILTLFIGTTFWCGYLSWKLNLLLENRDSISSERYQKNLRELELKADHGWFIRTICTELGMLGTIIGLILGLETVAKIQFDNIENSAQLISLFVKYLATAFVTTGIGLACGTLLLIQLQNLCNKIDTEKKEGNHDKE